MRKVMPLYLLPSAGKNPGPSSLYKKPKSFEEQFQNLQAEEVTSLTPTMLLTGALDTAVSTEEPPVLPATSPRSQVNWELFCTSKPCLSLSYPTSLSFKDHRDSRSPWLKAQHVLMLIVHLLFTHRSSGDFPLGFSLNKGQLFAFENEMPGIPSG